MCGVHQGIGLVVEKGLVCDRFRSPHLKHIWLLSHPLQFCLLLAWSIRLLGIYWDRELLIY